MPKRPAIRIANGVKHQLLPSLAFAIVLSMSFATQAADLRIPTTDVWAKTSYHVQKGHHYRIVVKDMRDVQDSTIGVHDLKGWPCSFSKVFWVPFFWTRRSPFNPWFSVIATVDRKHPRRLREDQDYIAPACGQLVCYFNDAPFAYTNNHGTATLTITPAP